MADFLWTSVKDVGNLGGHGIGSHHHLMDGPAGAMAGVGGGVGGSSASSSGCFDKDGLELALKFFLSSTLTMRLTGINQINQQINAFNEMCNTESVVEVEKVGLQLAGKFEMN